MGLEVSRYRKNPILYWPKNTPHGIVHYEKNFPFHDNYNYVQEKTQMKHSDNPLRRMRHYTLVQLFRNSTNIKGDVVECGTFRGLSAYQFSQEIQKKNLHKSFHIFDSFEGLSEISSDDRAENTKINDEQLRKQFSYDESLVRQNLSSFDFVNFYKGWIPERFKEVENNSFSFVHIDVDLYQPIKDSFEFFYPRLNKGGIMVFDDYGLTYQFPGAKKAIDEVINNITVSYFMELTSGQAFLIK